MRLTTDTASVKTVIDKHNNRPSVKLAMGELFGDLLTERNPIDLSKINNSKLSAIYDEAELPPLMQVRGSGSFRHKSFYLNPDYHWDIVTDNDGYMVLICSD